MAKKPSSVFNPRAITAPIAAVVMAGLLYTYSVSSIRAAKRNAQLHREADGGQLDMRRESLRRHGVLNKVEGTTDFALYKDSAFQKAESDATATNNTELKGKKKLKGKDRGPGGEIDLSGNVTSSEASRTDTEARLEDYKGRGRIVGSRPLPSE